VNNVKNQMTFQTNTLCLMPNERKDKKMPQCKNVLGKMSRVIQMHTFKHEGIKKSLLTELPPFVPQHSMPLEHVMNVKCVPSMKRTLMDIIILMSDHCVFSVDYWLEAWWGSAVLCSQGCSHSEIPVTESSSAHPILLHSER
jgi:hypothetical protein